MLSIAGALDAIVHGGRDFSQCDYWFDFLDTVQYEESVLPSRELKDQVACFIFSALVCRYPGHTDFDLWKERTHHVLKEGKNPLLRILAGTALSQHYHQEGDWAQATLIVDGLGAVTASYSVSSPKRIVYGIIEAEFCFFSGQLDQSLQAVANGLEKLEGSGKDPCLFNLLGTGAAASLASVDLEKAMTFLSKMVLSLDNMRHYDLVVFYILLAWDALLREDFSRAARYESQVQAIKALGAPLLIALGHYIMFQVMIEQHEYKKANVYLKKVSELGHRMKSTMIAFMSLLGESQLCLERGKKSTALRLLRKAMALGKEKGYVNFWIWRPKVMARLCVTALTHGIEPEYTKMLIKQRRLIPDNPPTEVEDWPWPLKIYTLGRFSIVIEGDTVSFSGRSQEKPLALLKSLIAFGGRDVPEEQVSHVLWPEAEGDKAHDVFTVTLQRLRKLISVEGAILLSHGRLTIDPRHCWVDLWAFERFLVESESASQSGEIDKAVISFEKAEKLYQGDFLSGDGREPWSIKLRERLRTKFLCQIGHISDHLCERRNCRQTMAYYETGLKFDELVEGLYQRVMHCHKCLGQHAEVLSTYNRLKRVLSTTLNINPSPKTEAIIKSIMES